VRISGPPTVYFIPEIIEQGLWCGENVGNLFLAYMLEIVTTAKGVVKFHNTSSGRREKGRYFIVIKRVGL
jgi:hypothetical protein